MRPEHLRLTDDPVRDGAVPAAVEHAEYLGHETLAHLRVEVRGAAEPAPLVVRVPGMPALAPGAWVGVVVDPARVHLFDERGRALAPRPEPGR
jgi:multiple sugar transport system ATP-binding protein